MTFLAIQQTGTVGHIALPIIKNTLEVVPDVNISITDLNRGTNNTKYKHFFNTGDGGITFKCTVLLNKDTEYKGTKFITILNSWIVNSTPVDITTDAIDIPSKGSYIITKNSSRTQTSDNYTEWDLEFTTYTPLTIWKFKNDNTEVLKALNKSKKDNKNKAKKSLLQKLSKCSLSILVYSKKKKKVECVKYLQKALQLQGFYLKGKVDGWFGNDTVKAVKQFQKKYKLKQTGKVDKKTFNKLIGKKTSNTIDLGGVKIPKGAKIHR